MNALEAQVLDRETTHPQRGAGLTLWQAFDAIASAHANRIALTFGDQHVTYSELANDARRLAVRLRSLGVGPDKLVGVYMERSPKAIVALLAIVKAGGAYLPMDPAYPMDRVVTILEDAKPAVLLSEKALIGTLPQHSAQLICLDELDADFPASEHDSVAAGPQSGPENLAYVIYTSGSTGKPKGVMVTHANVCRLLHSTEHWFHFSENDVWTLFHSLAFDFSVWEIWGCLLYGGKLVIVPFAVSRSPEEFYELLEREQVTVLNQTPSAFYQLIRVDQAKRSQKLTLRVVVFGGEALNFRALQPWFALHEDRRPRLVNMYGITETTVHVTYREVTAEEAASGTPSLIGVAIPDLRISLLGADRQPVPVGEVGEIYVSGAGVARGYLNRPALTAERFLPDAAGTHTAARMYKSGDLARYLPDGELEYLGRGDDQVKIQGFRIELGEVEAALTAHAAVREARVIAHSDADGTKRLVAYYVAKPQSDVASRDLGQFLNQKLPPWMVPSAYVAIGAFPLTPHGKVDYAALPAPTFGSIRTAQPDSAGTEWQRKVAEVWRQVLGANFVSLDDNFFDIGGNSLLLVAVHGKLQEAAYRKISIADLFAHTTVRSLAERLSGTDAGTDGTAARDQAQKQRAAFARARSMKKANQ